MRTEKSKLDVKEGSRFGHLLVVKTGLERPTGERYALCKCSCDHNKLFEIPQYLLRKGIKSCGCGGRVAVGDVFGRLTVVDNTLSIGNRAACKVRCSCGKSEDFIVKQSYLKKGATRSCGCLLDEARKTHGEAMTRLYHIWKGMKDRCRHSNRNYAKWYVENGISYSSEWEQYIPFRDWALSHGYSASLTLDRIDSTKGYSPSNCRWATREEQSNNKSNNVILEHDGKLMTISQWARHLGIKESLIRSRIRAGWSDEDALTLKSGTWRSSVKRD